MEFSEGGVLPLLMMVIGQSTCHMAFEKRDCQTVAGCRRYHHLGFLYGVYQVFPLFPKMLCPLSEME